MSEPRLSVYPCPGCEYARERYDSWVGTRWHECLHRGPDPAPCELEPEEDEDVVQEDSWPCD